MRVLVVPDKFKGTLTAREAADAIAKGWSEARPADQIQCLPMSDGGDGFGPVLGDLLNAECMRSEGTNAAGESHTAYWWWSAFRKTAIIETAQAIGLALLPRGKHHPFQLDTYALGKLFKEAATHQPEHVIIGIGGSATNDAGFGMARGIGFEFLDLQGKEINRWTDLERLANIRPPAEKLFNGRITVAVDVQNPLQGPQGATRIYGPQKGMRPEDFQTADRCFAKLVSIVRQDLHKKAEEEPGTGAAGGLGYGLRVFLDGNFKPGIDIFAEVANLAQEINNADLVITAEGAIDAQTLMGKGTGAIAAMAKKRGVPCIGLAGMLKDVHSSKDTNLFQHLASITPSLTSIEEAIKEPGKWLTLLARQTGSSLRPEHD